MTANDNTGLCLTAGGSEAPAIKPLVCFQQNWGGRALPGFAGLNVEATVVQ